MQNEKKVRIDDFFLFLTLTEFTCFGQNYEEANLVKFK